MLHKVFGAVPCMLKALGGICYAAVAAAFIVIRALAQCLIHTGTRYVLVLSSSPLPCELSHHLLPNPHSWEATWTSAQGERFWRLLEFVSLLIPLAVWLWGKLLYFSFLLIIWHEDSNNPCLTEAVIKINWVNVCKVFRKCLVCACAQLCLSFTTPWTVDCQDPLSMGFPRQNGIAIWMPLNGLPFLSAWDLPNPGIKPRCPESLALAGGFFTTSATSEA